MLIVDASCLFEALTAGAAAQAVRSRLEGDSDLAAPHIIDIEVFGIIRKTYLLGDLDSTAATQAVEDLRLWSGERFAHGALLSRAWELRRALRGWDAIYVALAEALDGTLLTTDQRLARATGPRCPIEVL